MHISPLDYMFITYQALQALSAVASAMPKPKKDGWYSFLYLFIHAETNNLDQAFEQKYHMVMPRVVDETAMQTITTPATKIESGVESTPTNPTQGNTP